MVQPEHEELSVRQQCALLHLARSNLYYQPVEAAAEELALMQQIDRLYLEHPYYGSRRMEVVLRQQGLVINRKRVQRLMRLRGMEGMAPGPRTSHPHPEHPRFPYLLRQLAIVRPDQVWASDITYVPLERGWAYLVVVMDWFSGAVLAFRLSNTLTVELCLEALEERTRCG
jgi:putative transposase